VRTKEERCFILQYVIQVVIPETLLEYPVVRNTVINTLI